MNKYFVKDSWSAQSTKLWWTNLWFTGSGCGWLTKTNKQKEPNKIHIQNKQKSNAGTGICKYKDATCEYARTVNTRLYPSMPGL